MKKAILLAVLMILSSLAFGQLVIGPGGQVTLGVGTITGLSDGNTITGALVSGLPPSSIGVNGDYFLDSASLCIWGPKASSAWPSSYIFCPGGSSFNPASPGPIGGTAPSTVNATTVTAITATVSGPIVSTGGFISADQYVLAPIYYGATTSNPINAPNGITAGGTNTFNQISVTGPFTLGGGTPMTSQSSANSQIVTCPPGGTSTQYCGADGAWHTITGGGMTYPGAGIGVSTGSAWGTSLTAPAGTLVGTTDTQTLTNKTVDGVTPTVFGYLDPTSSVQTQLNAKAPVPANALVTTTCPGSSLTMNTSTVVQASSACTITLPSGSTGSWASITAGKGYSAVTVNPPSGTVLLNGVSVSSVTIQPEDNAGFFWAGSQYIGSAHTMNPAFTTVSIGAGSAITSSGPGGALGTGAFQAAPTLSSLGGVPTSTTVNGHALSAPVVVSASDLTTGTLPASAEPAHTGDMTNSAGSLATSVVKVNGITPGGACTNQFARSISSSAVPTCASIAAADLTATVIPAVAVPTPGTSITLAAPSGFAICTGTCTVSIPVPAAGYQFCIMNDDNVSTAITLSALGSSARYENTARTAYGTAGTGTFTATAAAGNMVCIVGRDSTHYLPTNYVGTWTAN